MADEQTVLGIIGGSGFYAMSGIEESRDMRVESPWGSPSDALRCGVLGGVRVVFLARHGQGHVLSPSDINCRANIDAMKRAGVTDIISVSDCGSLKEHLQPGSFVLVDQFIDRTFARQKSFFGTGPVAHVSMAHPVCPKLVDALEKAVMRTSLGMPAFRSSASSGRTCASTMRSCPSETISITVSPGPITPPTVFACKPTITPDTGARINVFSSSERTPTSCGISCDKRASISRNCSAGTKPLKSLRALFVQTSVQCSRRHDNTEGRLGSFEKWTCSRTALLKQT